MMQSNNKYFIFFVVCFFVITRMGVAQNSCLDLPERIPVEEQVFKLQHYYNLIIEGKERVKNEEMFFCSFPNSFERMNNVFGFSEKDGAAPLYYHGEYIEFFYNIKNIDKESYYTKYINICIDGVWKVDNISECFGLYNKFFSVDSDLLISVLDNRDDKIIQSVLSFLFDGPHPSQRKVDYIRLYDLFFDKNKRLADLLKHEFAKLVKDEDLKE